MYTQRYTHLNTNVDFCKCLQLLGKDKSALSILFQLLTPFPWHFESGKEKTFSLQSNNFLVMVYFFLDTLKTAFQISNLIHRLAPAKWISKWCGNERLENTVRHHGWPARKVFEF